MSRLTDDYRAVLADIRSSWAQMREECRETLAQIRHARQLERRLYQRITGKDNPAGKELRKAAHAVLTEGAELDTIARRVIAEHRQEAGQ